GVPCKDCNGERGHNGSAPNEACDCLRESTGPADENDYRGRSITETDRRERPIHPPQRLIPYGGVLPRGAAEPDPGRLIASSSSFEPFMSDARADEPHPEWVGV